MTEEEAMAREAAAEKAVGFNDSALRRAFLSGWDAAMAHVEEQRVRSCTADMEIE